jgi:hypothetical protein
MKPTDVVTTHSVPKPPTYSTAVGAKAGERKLAVNLDPDRGREVGGSSIDDFNLTMIREVVATAWHPNLGDIDGVNATVGAAMAALAAFKPTDEIEGMLAAQAVALHFGAMECFRRSMLAGQQSEAISRLRKDGANLARGMTDMLEAMDRKRGKGPQVVRVERVVVHEGGQAIVGNVMPIPGGGRG